MGPRLLLLGIFILLASASAEAQEMLFPRPLHLTREIYEPLSNTTAIVDEYCLGNRIVSVRGSLTAIADYEKGELLEIDRVAGTYSVTRFEEIAKARARTTENRAVARAANWNTKVLAPRTIAGRLGDTLQSELDTPEGRQRIEITSDREITLKKSALEVLLGTAWPNEKDAHGEATLNALRPRADRMEVSSVGAEARYRLPLEEVISIEVEGQTVESRKKITRLGAETPPPALVTIPPGARLIESDLVRRSRLLEELDRLPTQAPKP